MNLVAISYKNIIARPLGSLLSWLLLTFGIVIIVAVLLVTHHLEQAVAANTEGIDLVIGAKGSPLQIILSNVFHADYPTGNIKLKEAAAISHNRYISTVVPLAVGDSYQAYRIVGTTDGYLGLVKAQLGKGEWCHDKMEVVLGSTVAKELHLALEDTFFGQHGLEQTGDTHDDGVPFKVVGILSPTGKAIDRLILTSVPSVWEVHEHEEGEHIHGQPDSLVNIAHMGLKVSVEDYEKREVTSLLVKYRSPMGAVTLPRLINANSNMQAASPAFEAARLFNIIGVGVAILRGLGMLIVIMSGLSVFIALLNSLKDRRGDIAIMRSLGASQSKVFLLIVLEGLIVTGAGVLSGLGIAHALVYLYPILSGTGLHLTGEWIAAEVWVLAGGLLLGVVASIIPAVMAYRTDISSTLAEN